MRYLLTIAAFAALLTAPMAANADDCTGGTATTHDMQVRFNGFYPATLYICSGDTVVFTNKTGSTMKFKAYDTSASTLLWAQSWLGREKTTTKTNLTGTGSITLSEIQIYGKYNAPQQGLIVFGSAPVSY